MTELVTILNTVKMTRDAGKGLWFMPGNGAPREISNEREWQLPPRSSVRVPGLRRNMNLIACLYNMKNMGRLQSLEVCSPWCAGVNADLASPKVLLSMASTFEAPISVGGWRQVDAIDKAAFQFADVPCPVKRLSDHPIYPFLLWPDGLREKPLIELLGHIGDPRWFIDPANPDRGNKLRQYLGLGSVRQEAAINLRSPRGRRYFSVLSCWYRDEPPEGWLEPNQFLWRLWREKGGGKRAELAVSKCLVNYIRQVWLMTVCRGGLASELFVPSLFFKEPDEVEAFTEFRKLIP
jgi:hypothetical protein